ncbi:hypothetical protein GOODEAATRI_000369 [Goodea atripinnis]|uniref:Uncharacterized protein n=1 Tax=Goodea atripinnis TaxID=208336 RepID=A0ABV0PJN5_9TELE
MCVFKGVIIKSGFSCYLSFLDVLNLFSVCPVSLLHIHQLPPTLTQHPAFTLPSFPEALLTMAHHSGASIPTKAQCGFSESWKLIKAINYAHQHCMTSPAVSPWL